MDMAAIKQNKFVFIGGGVVAVAGVLYYRHKQTAAAATVAAAVPTNPSTDPNAIDPATGQPYAMDGYSAAYDSMGTVTGSPYSAYSNLTWNPATGQFEAAPTNSTPDASNPTSNSAWGQQAEQYLAGLGDNPITVAAAVGKYLTNNGDSLTADELSIIQSAIGALGYPPQHVTDPHLAASTGQTNPGTGVTGTGGSPSTMNEVQVRAASPRVAALYAYYQAHPTAVTKSAYTTAVNQFRTGGESHVPTVADVQANDKAHGFPY